ncbi:complement factor I isoform X2 [Chanos chanos]|uniref:trypsin n=1 Tax=Chanos chanos TaxID=29144 RepID=A0A6J2VGH7_CHACN|nr:complement factor I isoform X2 [Chanos chanos]
MGRQTEGERDKNMKLLTISLILNLLLPQSGYSVSSTVTEPSPKQTKDPKDTKSDPYLGSEECLKRRYTRLSCDKVFCPPWMRCIDQKCSCKFPYQCLRVGRSVCGSEGQSYFSLCQALAISCRMKEPIFSHFGDECKEEDMFITSLVKFGDHDLIRLKTPNGTALVCGSGWNMAAANVVCRHLKEEKRGAAVISKEKFNKIQISGEDLPPHCISVHCTGSEYTLAECTLHQKQIIQPNMNIALVGCYQEPKDNTKCEFPCVNGKCISFKKTCDGVDHCGDNSDEMCCKACRPDGFHCKSGVCIPKSAVRDGIRDCLGGEDELEDTHTDTHTDDQVSSPDAPDRTVQRQSHHRSSQDDQVSSPDAPDQTVQRPSHHKSPQGSDITSDPKTEVKLIRDSVETLYCGIPNASYVYKPEEEESQRRRRKRVVGGAVASPTQIQWQVGIQEDERIYCGGAYLGGCWVLTAAHCVRPKPEAYHIKFSLWKKWSRQGTTDTIPVKNVIIHHDYNAKTYQNDIALIQLKTLSNSDKCMVHNPAVSAVCVPWSPMQFQTNDTCTISGWGRKKGGSSAQALNWANVTIIGDCKTYYKDRYFDGMECAGDLEGKVDSCQGDSGGPLVCKDASGVSYVWGIVSWGENCGQPGFPGVYTKVAHYFEWIRFHTGWPLVTKYNQ